MTAEPQAPPKKPLVTVRDLAYKIGRQTLFTDVSFSVYEGQCFGIFGTRGTGKTSLLHVLAGVEKHSAGRVEMPPPPGIGLVTQERSLFQDLNVGENLDYIATLKGIPRRALPPLADRLELADHLRRPVRPLEAGTYQRLSLACALMGSPAVLLVDELINDVDLPSRRIIIRELRAFLEAGGCCLWAFSNTAYIPQMDRVAWLENGRVTIYSPRAAAAHWQNRLHSHSPHRPANGENDA